MTADYRLTVDEAYALALLATVRPSDHDIIEWATVRDCVKRDWALTMLAWDLIDLNPEPEPLWCRLYDLADVVDSIAEKVGVE